MKSTIVDNSTEIECRSELDLKDIVSLDKELYQYFKYKLALNTLLTRALVSFQDNKFRSVYRWYKYKEAFSASLVEYLFREYGIKKGRVLDPFAGVGTSLFAAAASGIDADGIELLPVGQQIVATKRLIDSEFSEKDYKKLQFWASSRIWEQTENKKTLPELRITQGAYPKKTKEAIEKYLGACEKENSKVQSVLRFALLCVLESVSYTRKDGQYLRWDYRSGRRQGQKPFDKGRILNFEKAISEKINEIIADQNEVQKHLELFAIDVHQGKIRLYRGSCLDILPTLPGGMYDAIITSPPYCNRYDYTRTYALELAILGIDENGLSQLRQEMLSCTVENRAKDLLQINPRCSKAIEAADQQRLLQSILKYLDNQKAQGKLNNNGIPRMVRGYFYEMACVIMECARTLKPNTPLFMVNDNVRYAGVSIPVDMILSSIAERLGFKVERILVLPNEKGNSSQQMGEFGREPLRKCVYVWRKV